MTSFLPREAVVKILQYNHFPNFLKNTNKCFLEMRGEVFLRNLYSGLKIINFSKFFSSRKTWAGLKLNLSMVGAIPAALFFVLDHSAVPQKIFFADFPFEFHYTERIFLLNCFLYPTHPENLAETLSLTNSPPGKQAVAFLLMVRPKQEKKWCWGARL